MDTRLAASVSSSALHPALIIVSLLSMSGLRSVPPSAGMERPGRLLGQVMLAPNTAGPAPASCHHRAQVTPPAWNPHWQDNGRQKSPWPEPASSCLAAGASREGQGEERRSNEEPSKWLPPGSSGPGFPPSLSNRAPFQGPAQPRGHHSRIGMSCSCICKCMVGRQTGELPFLMKQDHRERADAIGNNSLQCFWRKRRERSQAERHRGQSHLQD